jgi:hypothetical protein
MHDVIVQGILVGGLAWSFERCRVCDSGESLEVNAGETPEAFEAVKGSGCSSTCILLTRQGTETPSRR